MAAIFFLFIGFLLCGLAHGINKSECYDLKTSDLLNIESIFSGTWYELERTNNSFEAEGECSHVDFSTFGGGSINALFGNQSFLGSFSKSNAFLNFPNNPTTVTIIATDEGSYAMLYSCVKADTNGLSIKYDEWVWLLARNNSGFGSTDDDIVNIVSDVRVKLLLKENGTCTKKSDSSSTSRPNTPTTTLIPENPSSTSKPNETMSTTSQPAVTTLIPYTTSKPNESVSTTPQPEITVSQPAGSSTIQTETSTAGSGNRPFPGFHVPGSNATFYFLFQFAASSTTVYSENN